MLEIGIREFFYDSRVVPERLTSNLSKDFRGVLGTDDPSKETTIKLLKEYYKKKIN
jgi:hypothetical protein